jgi:hypothetical protein
MAKALAIASDGSNPLRNTRHERYARLRAQALPRNVAFRKAGNVAENDNVIDANACRLEKKPGVRERIDYLVRQAEDRIIEKRRMLEEQLWSVMEADIGDFFETYEAAKTNRDGKPETDQGKMLPVRKQRAKLINDLPPESRKLIEDFTVDRHGNFIPKLYSKPQANQELRKMLGIGRQTESEQSDVSRLSDAQLIQQLADQAKELGIDIDLSYSFAKPVPTASEPTEVNEVIDGDSKAAEPTAADRSGANADTAGNTGNTGNAGTTGIAGDAGNERDLQAARELAISAQPAIPQRRQGSTESGARRLNKGKR